jgi:hypothetical protein
MEQFVQFWPAFPGISSVRKQLTRGVADPAILKLPIQRALKKTVLSPYCLCFQYEDKIFYKFSMTYFISNTFVTLFIFALIFLLESFGW